MVGILPHWLRPPSTERQPLPPLEPGELTAAEVVGKFAAGLLERLWETIPPATHSVRCTTECR